jgi:hypothetical protein
MNYQGDAEHCDEQRVGGDGRLVPQHTPFQLAHVKSTVSTGPKGNVVAWEPKFRHGVEVVDQVVEVA